MVFCVLSSGCVSVSVEGNGKVRVTRTLERLIVGK
jgi:hypothetical protein